MLPQTWYNYIAKDRATHVWMWPSDRALEYFFTGADWGVSAKWLRQHTQRMAHQYVAFHSESAVHRAAAERTGAQTNIPCRPDLKMKSAWFMWRLVVHKCQCGDAHAAGHPLLM